MPTPREVVRAWVAAFNRGDVDGLAALYADDATNHQVVQEPIHGRAAIRAMFEREFAGAEMTCIGRGRSRSSASAPSWSSIRCGFGRACAE